MSGDSSRRAPDWLRSDDWKFSCEIRLGKWLAGDETLAQAWHRVQNRWTG